MTSWLQPPRLRVGEEAPRHATWLELFYDLVFVVAVSQLAHNLSDDTSIVGFVGFVALFLPVWWTWIGATFYANRFDSDDISRRLLMGIQMLTIAALAVNVHHGLSDTSVGFALSYVAARIVLIGEYLRAGRSIPSARGLTTHFAIGFSIAAALWVISIFVPIPIRFGLWAIALLIDFATPITAARYQRNLLPDLEHLPERFGLFTIIVLGEAIIAVVNGVSEMEWDGWSEITAALGFVCAFCLWWIYFENVGSAALRAAGETGRLRVFQVWLFGHLPLVIGLAAAGVGVEHLILAESNAPLSTLDRWLVCGSLALCFLSLALLHRTGVIFFCKSRTRHRIAAAIVLLVLAIAAVNWSPVAIALTVAIVCISQVGLDLYQGHPAGWQKDESPLA
ncbi:low temperature requirement protein A [Microcoleus sp. FACHB-1515]|uniref:low temperature requirement protein A n=1 Tax=Cyanophyceae TaxID=3028117 RepID=UPI001686069C|nr:low temperature requirement protein A [Microcoleus sp. FACHB-1515]MBD2091069.1 low temperature requirement protein A [Microcoleus sp. FACHB-1515]